jgi:cobalt-zinc-cadmium efflux system membrane fusion protein
MKNKSLCAMSTGEHSRRWARTIALAAIAAVTIATLAGCSPKADDKPQAASANASNIKLTPDQRKKIRFYTVAPSRFHKTIDTTGVVDFDNDQATSVLAAFSGPVSRLLVSPGDRVKKGDALATVDSSDFATAISAYQKALVTARNARSLADKDADLVQHNGVSQRENEQAQTDAANAEADRDAALQGLISLSVDPKSIKDIQEGRTVSRIDGIIRSPITGTVVEKLITPGQLLQAGSTPCFTVADLSRVWVMAQIYGGDVAAVDLGDTAKVITGIGSNDFSGKVTNISALVNPDTRSVVARVVVENPRGVLKKQMYVRVLIEARHENAGRLIPVSALLRDDENLPFVYLAEANGSFSRRHVTLGYRSGEQIDITDGLMDGDQVVVDGGIFVQFMQDQ